MRLNVIPCSCVTATQPSISASPHSKSDHSLQTSGVTDVRWGIRQPCASRQMNYEAFLTIEKCLSISLKSESRPLPTPEHPQRKHPIAVGEWKESLRKNSGLSVPGLQSEWGPGTAHILFWPLGSPQWPPPPPLMDAGPLGSPYRHALFTVWRSSGGQRGWEDSVGKEDSLILKLHTTVEMPLNLSVKC